MSACPIHWCDLDDDHAGPCESFVLGTFGTPPPESIETVIRAIADAPDAPVCLGCGAPTDGAELHPGCGYDASPATPEERDWCARCDMHLRQCRCRLATPSDLDRANARRIVAEQRDETLRDALRDMVAGWRRAAESGGIGGACLADCVDAIESLLAAHAGDDRGESDGAEVGQ